MATDAVVDRFRNTVNRALESRVLKLADPATAVADDVVVVSAGRVLGLVAGRALTRVEPSHESELVQQVERAVDGRDTHLAPLNAQLGGDLAGGGDAILAREDVDHRRPLRAGAMPRALHRCTGVVGPSVRVRVALLSHSDSHSHYSQRKMDFLLGPFQPEFMRYGVAEVLLLSIPAGFLGAQIVLRRLSFFIHGVGAATFPGLVVAGPLGVAAPVAALVTGTGFAAGLSRARRAGPLGADAATALLLVAALAVGIVLASDVFKSGAGVDQLLFGTLLGIGPGELAFTAAAVAVVGGAAIARRRIWVAAAFEEDGARAMGLPVDASNRVLLVVLALAVVAAVDAAGALLVTAILVVPAATVRLLAGDVRSLELGAGALAAGQGVVGLWIAYRLDVPPGPAIAVLGGGVFATVAVTVAVRASVIRAGA